MTGGQVARRFIEGQLAKDLAAVHPTLVLVREHEDEEVLVLALSQQKTENHGECLITRFDIPRGQTIDEHAPLILQKAKEVVWWAQRGDLLEQIDEANYLAERARKIAADSETYDGANAIFDMLLGLHRFQVNGLKPC